MCRGAAANAKEGCNKLVKQTAVTTTTTKTIRTNFKANTTLLPTCVFKGMCRQKNDVGKKRKRASNAQSFEAQRIVLPPGLAIPHRVARQQSPTPFHQATKIYTTKKRSQKLRAQNVRPEPETKPQKLLETAS
jgi:hypothetical protein